MFLKENIAVAGILLCLVLMSIMLQSMVLNRTDAEARQLKPEDYDYYMDNIVITGEDDEGKRYEVIADRLVHYPVEDRAFLDNPHIIQYVSTKSPQHVHADKGWLFNNRTTVQLLGNVRVIQEHGSDPELVTTTEKMIIQLKDDKG